MKKTALVLEGGGMRGLYTAGVLDCFLNNNLEFDYVIGVSAGACNALSYISKQHERNYRINTGYTKDKRYISYKNLLTTGSIFGMDMMFNLIPNELDPFDYDTFKSSKTKLNIVVTNCETGLGNYYDIDDLNEGMEIIKASMSLPLVSTMVKYDEKIFLDGGIVDPIPVQKALDEGYDKVVVILTQHKGYVKLKTSTIPLLKVKYKKYPKFIKAMEQRHEKYNKTLAYLEELESEGKVFVIRPDEKINVQRLERDAEKLKEVYRQGLSEGNIKYELLKEFLEK